MTTPNINGIVIEGAQEEDGRPVLADRVLSRSALRELPDPAPLIDDVEFFDAYVTFVTTDGAKGREQLQHAVSRRHRFRNVVQQDVELLPGVVGCLLHDASPSLAGLDNRSVGEGRRPARASGFTVGRRPTRSSEPREGGF